MEKSADGLEIRELIPELWNDFEHLFGSRGAYGGCWCMWWRLSRREFEQSQGEANRTSMKSIVDSGAVPGVLAYRQGLPVGWCSIAPRTDFPSLERSPVLKRVDQEAVWSIVCLYVHREARGAGLSTRIVTGAVQFAASRGARIVEAYPSVVRSSNASPATTFMGTPGIYDRAGFLRVHQPSRSKLIMRCHIRPPEID